MSDRDFGIETLCLHAGQLPDAVTGSRAQPIYQTTSYVFDSADHAASLFNLQTFGNVYSRISNPTVAVFEERVAALENGRAALATASGMAAQLTAILAILQPGDHIVSSSLLYGGTYSQFAVTLPKMGITTTFVDPDQPDNYRRAIQPNTRLMYGETLGNPKINVLDIERIAAVARDAQIPLMIDNTMASPYLCRPLDWGADIVVHSA
ncbi:MAG: PLP-dependent transferase, partial [Burkholderiaceae bacterium]|nr:PLP-dependent transferase [Burkholderiaceae bacterium]